MVGSTAMPRGALIRLPVVPQPLNVFMDVRAGEDGILTSHPASSGPGDYLAFQAHMDCLVE